MQRGNDQRGVRESDRPICDQHPRVVSVVIYSLGTNVAKAGLIKREGVDDGQQQPAAIARGHDSHHRTDHQADQRPDVQ